MPHTRRRVLKTSGMAAGALAGGLVGLGDLCAQPSATPIARAVDTPVLRVGYEESGSPQGFPIVLLHGFPDDVRAWDEVAPPLVRAGYRVLVPYLR